MRTITISEQFCGPPTSANGGITAGLLAQHFGLSSGRSGDPYRGAVEVTLKAPPSLGVAMLVEAAPDGLSLLHDEILVATARPADPLKLPSPPDISYRDAEAIALHSPVLRDADTHPFPTCFVCGPHRLRGDGLRIFAAQLPGGDAFVAPFCPTRAQIGPEFAWAAMDCPSSFPMYLDTDPLVGPYVLGRMTAQLHSDLQEDREYVVAAWRDEVSGRKLMTSVVLYEPRRDDADTVVVGSARSVWIRL